MSKNTEVNSTTRALADSLKAAMTGSKGNYTAADNWYGDNLPEGLTTELRARFDEHDSSVVAATALALGELAVPEMKENADITEATLALNLGANRINTSVLRDYVHGKESYHGHVIASYEVNSAGVNRGELGLAMTAVRNLADDLLG
jgi:hypothetical protein